MSSGLKEPITVPKGMLKEILDRVALTEKMLGLEVEQYRVDTPKYWRDPSKPKEGVSNETFCDVASEHNRFVRWLYQRFGEYSKTPAVDGETITIEDAATFWHGLKIIDVPAHKWTGDYYKARMDALYEAMRGRESEGIIFDSKPLTPRQAADVINLFSQFLDHDDLRLDVPKDCDHLASLDDGGYEWCEKCGAVTYEYAELCRKRGCPLKELFTEEKEGD
jgi:hypothetical protein